MSSKDFTIGSMRSERYKHCISALAPDYDENTHVIISGELNVFSLVMSSYSLCLPKDFSYKTKLVVSPQNFVTEILYDMKNFMNPYNDNNNIRKSSIYPTTYTSPQLFNNPESKQKMKKIHRLFNTKNISVVEYIKNLTSIAAYYTGIIDESYNNVPFRVALYSTLSSQSEDNHIAFIVAREHLDKFNETFAEYISSRIDLINKFLEDIIEQIVNVTKEQIINYRLEVSSQSFGNTPRTFGATKQVYTMGNGYSRHASGNVSWTPMQDTIIKRDIETIYMPQNLKKEIIQALDDFFDPTSLAFSTEHSIIHKLTLLFYGISGTGKTSLIKAIATKYNLDIATIKMSRMDMTDELLTDALISVPDNAIFVIEEIDACFDENRKSNMHNTVTLGSLLDMLDGLNSHNNQIFIMTTNHKEKLDDALVRNGRVTYSFPFDYIQKPEIIAMTKDFYPNECQQEIEEFTKELMAIEKNFVPAYLQQLFVHYRKLRLCDLIKKIKNNDIVPYINTKTNTIYDKKLENATQAYMF